MGGEIKVPGWLAGLLGLLLTGFVPWCATIGSEVASIRTKLDSVIALQAAEVQRLSERIGRNEAKIDKLDERLRTLETGKPETKP